MRITVIADVLGEENNGTTITVKRLINNLRKEPINIDTRQERYIRLVFKARNAVSHYNSGYTSKELCDLMLTGISSIFNDYYRNSVEKYKEEK